MVTGIFCEWSWMPPALPVDSWWFFAIVLVVLVFFIAVIARLTTQVTGDADPAECDREMLNVVRELHSRGELSADEFRSIKSRLIGRLAERQPETDSDDSAQQVTPEQENEGTPEQIAETNNNKGEQSSGPLVAENSSEVS